MLYVKKKKKRGKVRASVVRLKNDADAPKRLKKEKKDGRKSKDS